MSESRPDAINSPGGSTGEEYLGENSYGVVAIVWVVN
jgi:hypothetical protein